MSTKNILCFGDSVTWGWVPKENGVPTERFAPDVRWTGVLADRLGEGYHVIEEGLSGRTTAVDDPTDPRLNGSTYPRTQSAMLAPAQLVGARRAPDGAGPFRVVARPGGEQVLCPRTGIRRHKRRMCGLAAADHPFGAAPAEEGDHAGGHVGGIEQPLDAVPSGPRPGGPGSGGW